MIAVESLTLAQNWGPTGAPFGRILELLTMLGVVREPEEAPAAAPAISALRDRNPGAWKALFNKEMPAIYRYALSRTGQSSDAEDLTSQVFEEAWRNADHLQDRGLPPRAWLFGIARNVLAGHRRKILRRPPPLAIEAYDGSTDDAALSADLIDLAEAIAKLPSAQAEVVSLRFIHGLSLQETADTLRSSVDSVKGKQARALASLKANLEGAEEAP